MADDQLEENRIDPLNEVERSKRMASVRSSGNKSTELVVEAKLIEHGIVNWTKHPKGIIGKPDFYFRDVKLAVFVNGCFWHACPKCKRNTPRSSQDYWRNKIESNRRRDNRNYRRLRQEGFHVIRIWEHELKHEAWLKRLKSMLNRLRAPEHTH